MTDTPEPDPLDGLLRPVPRAADPTFRRTLLGRTRAAVRRRVSARRLLAAAALAACFAAGVVTTALLWKPSATPPGPGPIVEPDRQATPAPLAAVEDRAVKEPDRRAELFREAGKRYLAEQGDLQAAVRCYGHSLDAAAPSELTIAPEDDWLLMALKHARQEERRHVTSE